VRHTAFGLAALASLAACGGGPPLPEQDLLLSVAIGADEVTSGQAFPLTVVRAWTKDVEPSTWDERALAPLVLRLEETARREDGRHVEETRRYRAYAFARTDVLVPAAKLTARPRDGGPERSVTSQRRRLRVRTAVDALAPGPPELPGEPLPEPVPWVAWAVGAGGVVGLLLGLWIWRRRRALLTAAPAPVAAEPDAPADRARDRLRALLPPREDRSDRWWMTTVLVVAILREYVAGRYGVRTRERTTEEILAALPNRDPADAAARARLADLLRHGDAVKFAGHAPTRAEFEAFPADALAYVDATDGSAAR
jgi:hypothetical protein